MNSISKTKQSTSDLSFFKIENCLSFKEDFVGPCSFMASTVAEGGVGGTPFNGLYGEALPQTR